MTQELAIALAQINPTVGDVAGNLIKIRDARAKAAALKADLVVFGELVLSGYPPEDLVLKPAFQAACRAAIETLARETADGGPAMLVGSPWVDGGKLYNAALLLADGAVLAQRYKVDLPNYGVFDEKRVFAPAPPQGPMNFREVRLGVMICEDMWTPEVTETLSESGAEILLVPNGSPYEHAKYDERIQLAGARSVESNLPIIYVNQIGGQDELVFDGASFALDADATLKAQLPAWQEAVALTRWRRSNRGWHCAEGEMVEPRFGLAGIYQAMMLGLRDYVEKNRFPGVVLGLSGGIDSAISAAVAVDALGPGRVRALMLPSPYTSRDSLEDAAACAHALGIRIDTISIEPAMQAFTSMLAPHLRRPRARHDRGEYPEPRPRRHLDGLLQQARTYGALHRQQIRDVGGLCHALRRYVRRLFRAEGCLQDHRLCPLALAQRGSAHRRRWARGRRDPGTHPDQGRRRRS